MAFNLWQATGAQYSSLSGSWSTAGHWSLGHAPGSSDDILFNYNLLGAFTATIDAPIVINSLLVQAAAASVIQSSLAPMNIAGAVTVNEGLLSLNSVNAIGGAVTVNGGELDIGMTGALASSSLTLSGGELLATSSITIANNIGIGDTCTIAAAHGATLTLTGILTDDTAWKTIRFGASGQDGIIILNGTGGVLNGGAQIEVAAGTLKAANSELNYYTNFVLSTSVDAGAILDVNGQAITINNLFGSGTVTNTGLANVLNLHGGSFSGSITGSLGVSLGGSVTLSGVNTFTGGMGIGAYQLTIGNGGALGSGQVALANGSALLATGSMTVGNAMTLNASGANAFLGATSGVLTLTGVITLTAASQRILIGGAGAPGSVTFANGGGVRLFNATDAIDFLNVAYSASEKIVWQSTTNGAQNFALVNNLGATLATFSLVASSSYGHYSTNDFTIANDGSGDAVVGLNYAPPPLAKTRDFNFDGVSDVMLENASTGQLGAWFVSGGVATWNYFSTESAGWHAAGTGDFNGNGTADVLLENSSTGMVGTWLINGGVPTWQYFSSEAAGWHIAGVGNFDGNTTADVLLENSSTGQIGAWLINGGVPTWAGFSTEASGFHVAGVGDFNGDGVSDVLLENSTTGMVGTWEIANNTPTWAGFTAEASGFHVAGVGDFNGDGVSDVLLENSTTGMVGTWEIANNTPTWVGFTTEAAGWHVAGVGDYNGDGVSDVLLMNNATGMVGDWSISNNTPTWHYISSAAAGWNAS